MPTGEIGANERMRHVAEGRFLILRELDLREARHKRCVNECANSRTRAAAPLLVRDARIDFEGLVAPPAQDALDQPAWAVGGEERASEEDAEGVHAVLGNLLEAQHCTLVEEEDKRATFGIDAHL